MPPGKIYPPETQMGKHAVLTEIIYEVLKLIVSGYSYPLDINPYAPTNKGIQDYSYVSLVS